MLYLRYRFTELCRCYSLSRHNTSGTTDEFYEENIYGVIVPMEWFQDKWGGVGIGVITITKPNYIRKLLQSLSVDSLSDIVAKAGEEGLIKDIRELVEETFKL